MSYINRIKHLEKAFSRRDGGGDVLTARTCQRAIAAIVEAVPGSSVASAAEGCRQVASERPEETWLAKVAEQVGPIGPTPLPEEVAEIVDFLNDFLDDKGAENYE